MTAIRDMYCTSCRETVEDVEVSSLAITTCNLYCPTCGKETLHADLGHGGTKKRFRQQDWPDSRSNPEFYHGQTSSTVEAFTVDDAGTETPVSHYKSGETMHQHDKYVGDLAEERRDRNYHAMKARAGKNPIYVTR